jgi:hypothetical protein
MFEIITSEACIAKICMVNNDGLPVKKPAGSLLQYVLQRIPVFSKC